MALLNDWEECPKSIEVRYNHNRFRPTYLGIPRHISNVILAEPGALFGFYLRIARGASSVVMGNVLRGSNNLLDVAFRIYHGVVPGPVGVGRKIYIARLLGGRWSLLFELSLLL
ncbi:Hypothetical protein D9617_78g011960 [Elsinoe fawcettii]|nr:Hypothetical protein D9617_78g011960 [Elsinoe fawcettii]